MGRGGDAEKGRWRNSGFTHNEPDITQDDLGYEGYEQGKKGPKRGKTLNKQDQYVSHPP
jgi:hypothetical protein